jgi:hypothetical protein
MAKVQLKSVPTTQPLHKEADLAQLIAAILANPYTPTALYNAIGEALNELENRIPSKERTDSAEQIERVLNWHQGFGYRNIERGRKS